MYDRHPDPRAHRTLSLFLAIGLSLLAGFCQAASCEIQNEQRYTVPAANTSFVLEDLPVGVNEFSIVTRDTFGLVSAPSIIGTKTINLDVTTATLRWIIPTTRVDDTPLPFNEIKNYEIIHKLPMTVVVDCDNPPEPEPDNEVDIDTSLYVADGATSPTGVCLATEYIFSGRAMRCDLAGKSTAYQNCCKDHGKVYSDSNGSLVATAAGAQLLGQTAAAAAVAYESYAVSTAMAVEAGQAANLAAGDFIAAFDPVSLAITVAVTVLVQYFTQSCDQISMETAMLNSSGYCYEMGEFCRKSNTFGCVQRSNSYCCFNSKMAALIHKQGRPQLIDFDWGTTEAPNCRGFTPEEFQAIDFSQIDFTTYYNDLIPDTTLMEQTVNEGVTDFINNTQ